MTKTKENTISSSKYKKLDNEHILIKCVKCKGEGIISTLPSSPLSDQKSCDICGGQGEIRIKVPTITKDSPVQIFTCHKCKGSGLGDLANGDNHQYPGSCLLCNGIGVLSAYQLVTYGLH